MAPAAQSSLERIESLDICWFLMELTGNEDRPQFDKFMWERKEKSGRLWKILRRTFSATIQAAFHRGFISNVGLAAAEEGSGCDDYVDAQEKF